MIERLCLIGVGLIGGSLSLALRQAGYCRSVIGVGRNPENLRDALDLDLIDEASHDPAAAVEGADMVVLAVPVGSTETVCRQIRDHLSETAILTDAGSVKGDVVAQVRRAFGALPASFVPGHPVAGHEKSGARASLPDLYAGRRVLLTPTEATAESALKKVRQMWEVTGAIVETMTVAHHDKVLAATSHLPHLLAFGLVDSLARLDDSREIFKYAAGGFRDFTRIASSDPTMWKDICLHNRTAIMAALENYQNDLNALKHAIDSGDAQTLQTIFTRAKSSRDQFVDLE